MGWSGRLDAVSPDGTPVVAWRAGSGPPLVLVHGSTSESSTWLPSAGLLGERVSIVAVERRGRGESGDGAAYSLEAEAQDLAAILDALGEPAHVLGHSFGGLVALEGALLRPDAIRTLVLYEPPLGGGVELELVERLEALLAADERDRALETVYAEVAGMSAEEIDRLRGSDLWERRRAAVPTVPREFRAARAYRLDAARFAGLDVAAVLLVGTESPAWMREAAHGLVAALPRARVVELAGQGHVAHVVAPGVFARAVLAALT
jgi:pimeloyl-ACP methyl ester carboxylesterase